MAVLHAIGMTTGSVGQVGVSGSVGSDSLAVAFTAAPVGVALTPGVGGVCGAGYCTSEGSGRSTAPPAGLADLALGLVGSGVAAIRRERRR